MSSETSRQIARVLRLRAGEVIALLDGTGREVVVRLTRVSDREVSGIAGVVETPDREPRLMLELVMALPRQDRWEFVLQKATELGVAAIQPIESSRCVVHLSQEQWDRKKERWDRIIVEAVEQCGRTRFPALHPPISLRGLVERGPAGLLLHTASELPSLYSRCVAAKNSIRILVGPEGGLDEAESALLEENLWQPVSMGPRTLRCETAAIAACTIALSTAGDLGG